MVKNGPFCGFLRFLKLQMQIIDRNTWITLIKHRIVVLLPNQVGLWPNALHFIDDALETSVGTNLLSASYNTPVLSWNVAPPQSLGHRLDAMHTLQVLRPFTRFLWMHLFVLNHPSVYKHQNNDHFWELDIQTELDALMFWPLSDPNALISKC